MHKAAGLHKRLRERSFSLIELVVSLAVFSIGILILLQAVAFSARVTGLCSDSMYASFILEDKLQELEFKEKQGLLGDEPRVKSGTEGKFEWVYRLDEEKELGLYTVACMLRWPRMNRKEKIEIHSYLR